MCPAVLEWCLVSLSCDGTLSSTNARVRYCAASRPRPLATLHPIDLLYPLLLRFCSMDQSECRDGRGGGPPLRPSPTIGRTIVGKKDDSDPPGGMEVGDFPRSRTGRPRCDVGVGRHRVSDPSPTTRVATHLDAREVGKLNVRANLHASRESYDAHRPRAGLEGVSRARDRFRHFGGTNQRTCRKRTISSRDRRSARDRVKNRCG